MTNLQLLAQRYNSPAIPLHVAMQDFVNPAISLEQCNRKANAGEIPFHCYKAGDKKSGWYVHIKNLAKWLDEKEKECYC